MNVNLPAPVAWLALRYERIGFHPAFAGAPEDGKVVLDIVDAHLGYHASDKPREIWLHRADDYHSEIWFFLQPLFKQLCRKRVLERELVLDVDALFCLPEHCRIPRLNAPVLVKLVPGAERDDMHAPAAPAGSEI